MSKMPVINPAEIDCASETEKNILAIVVKKNGMIRATKPKVKDDLSGMAAYVWRMVCFTVSPHGAHHCMPVCAEFDLPARGENGKWSSPVARQEAKVLDVLVDKIINAVPKQRHYGTLRWGKALGYF